MEYLKFWQSGASARGGVDGGNALVLLIAFWENFRRTACCCYKLTQFDIL